MRESSTLAKSTTINKIVAGWHNLIHRPWWYFTTTVGYFAKATICSQNIRFAFRKQ